MNYAASTLPTLISPDSIPNSQNWSLTQHRNSTTMAAHRWPQISLYLFDPDDFQLYCAGDDAGDVLESNQSDVAKTSYAGVDLKQEVPAHN